MELIFASNNLHKLEEIRALAGSKFIIKGLEESGITDDIPEDFDTLEENASQKAWFIYKKLEKNCFADDTGLETDTLKGEPGVLSARYSRTGVPVYPDMPVTEGNIKKLLEKLENKPNRKARFRTVICLIMDGREYLFEGIAEGEILTQKTGDNGFGYDPVFCPEGYNTSFAEMSLSEKNRISHRAKALQKLMYFLLNY